MSGAVGAARRLGRFWFDFVVGDDPWVAVALLVALGATGLLVAVDVNAWWLIPAAVAVVLPATLWRATRSR